ncbi:MAG: hypothetical protein AAB628_02610 [Patescibacteria group bacterium]
MNFKQSPFEAILEQKKKRYEENSEGPAQKKIPGEELIIQRSGIESTEDKITEEERNFLAENDITSERTGNLDAGYIKDTIKGVVGGKHVEVSQKKILDGNKQIMSKEVGGESGDKSMEYEVKIDGKETILNYTDRKHFFNNLLSVINRREAILSKRTGAISRTSSLFTPDSDIL